MILGMLIWICAVHIYHVGILIYMLAKSDQGLCSVPTYTLQYLRILKAIGRKICNN